MNRPIVSVCLSVCLSVTAHAQILIESEDHYSFSACQAIAVEAPTAANPNVVFAGMGGGVALVNASGPNNPSLWTGTAKNRLFTGGFVRSATIARGGGLDHLYVAAGRRGAMGYNLANQNDPISGFPTPNSLGDAWAVASVTVAGSRYLFVGSQAFPGTVSGPGTGTIVGYRLNPGPVTVPTEIVVPAAVYSLAVSTNLATDGAGNPLVTLLAGTCAGLKRFDIPLANFTASGVTIPTNYTTYDPQAFGNPTLVRDIVIHESLGYAFLACHGRGLHRVSVAGPSGTLASTPGYPILNEGGATQIGTYVETVALSPDGSRLVVGMGHGFQDESQYWGACAEPKSCDGADYNLDLIPTRGLRVFSSLAAAGPTLDASLTAIGRDGLKVIDVATREITAGSPSFHIDCATDTHGYRIVRFDPGTNPPLTAFGSFADDNDHMLLGSVDDVVVHQHPSGTRAVYAATEHGVSTLPLVTPIPGANDFESAQPHIAKNGAIWLTVPQAPLSQEWILASELSAIKFYRLSPNPLSPTALLSGLNIDGRYSIGVRALSAPSSASGQAWMYVCSLAYFPSDWDGSGIQIFDISNVLNGTVADPSTLAPLATFIDEAIPFPASETLPKNRQLLDLHVAPVDGERQVIYANYGPGFGVQRPDGTLVAEGEAAAGLLVLEAKYVASSGIYSMTVKNKVVAQGPGIHNPCQPGRVTVAGTTLAAAYGCNGSALFNIGTGDPYSPTLIGYRHSEGRSTLQAGLTPSGKAYVIYLDGTIDVMPISEFSCDPSQVTCTSAGLQRFRSPFQPNQITRDPQNGELYLADGRGGVYRIVLP